VKLAMLVVFAPDLAGAKAFYGGVLGFALKSETPQRLVFAHEGVDLVIFKGNANAVPYRHGEDAHTVFVFAVPSLDVAMTALKQQGVSFLHDRPNQNEFGRYAAFRDPFGNVLELSEPA
jgi:predicted enzyme related to lactoylglutathione lyase